jgi:subtilase family serine protease
MASTWLSGSETVADVISNSYGWAEDQQCQISPNSQQCQSGGSQAFVDGVNTLYQKLGATGTTIVFASGDAGSHGRSDPLCSTSKTTPAFPASSPYVVAVGAT